jgi:hypothetical protein
MKNIANHNTDTPSSASRKIARNILIALTALNALFALVVGILTLVNMQGVFEGFGITYTRELESIGLPAAGLLILIAVLAFISIFWLVQGKIEGILVPFGHATFLFALGFMAFARLGQTDILYIDSIRGFLTMVAGFFAYREMRR